MLNMGALNATRPCLHRDSYLDSIRQQTKKSLEETLGLAHGGLDVERTNVLPLRLSAMLLQFFPYCSPVRDA